MKYTETESLKASGFNGYIKYGRCANSYERTSADVLSSFDLSDNAPQFASVHNYIDGLQKNLETTLMWFSLVFVMLMLILLVIVSLVQVVVFTKYMAHNELKNVLAAFKGA